MSGNPRSMLCGHPESAVVQADEGTAYCGDCAMEASRSVDYDALAHEVQEHLDWSGAPSSTCNAFDALEAELTRLRRVEEAARDYLTITTYDQDPRTWNGSVLGACEALSEALASNVAEVPE